MILSLWRKLRKTIAFYSGLAIFNPRRLWSFFISQEAQLPWQQLQPRIWLLAFRRLVYEFCTGFMCQVQPQDFAPLSHIHPTRHEADPVDEVLGPKTNMDFGALGFELQAYCCLVAALLDTSQRRAEPFILGVVWPLPVPRKLSVKPLIKPATRNFSEPQTLNHQLLNC